ncbi:MAG: ATP-binding protein [Treponema sp.]|jgi:anti-sigma regulatory factor (Ser/Thr protein kinase)|nr:ATP-binding protein [Treponema sp.]
MATSTGMQVITLPAEITQLEKVLDFIRSIVEKTACPRKIVQYIEIAAEEIFVNIVHYAYPVGEPGVVRIECKMDPTSKQPTVIIVFADQGKPYNPLKHQDPDITVPIEERHIGGLGILMTKRIMDSVEYQYTKGWNYLVIKKSW